jgi:glutamine synthetase
MLNAAVAESLSQYADRLETVSAEEFNSAVHALVRDTIRAHKRILFNGNGYGDEWMKEAERRGLLNLHSTPEAIPHLLAEKNIALLSKHGIFSESEIRSRYEVLLENYCKVINIEALTAVDMVKKDILPAVSRYLRRLGETYSARKAILPNAPCAYETETAERLSFLSDKIYALVGQLEENVASVKALSDVTEKANAFEASVLGVMKELRTYVDEAEGMVASDFWPYPSYGELLLGV